MITVFIKDTIDYTAYQPFQLVEFTGAASTGKTVDLEWTVANERMNVNVVIERGDDSVHFTPIDSLTAKNNYTAGDMYSYTDHMPQPGLNFYRLKFNSTDGTSIYSAAIPVTVDKTEVPGIYPNPAINSITIYKNGGNINAVTIYNSQGTPVIMQSYPAGQTSVTLDIRILKHGVYYIKIKTPQHTYTERLLLLI